MNINIAKLTDKISSEYDLFVCSSGFEDRWYSIASSLINNPITRFVVLVQSDEDPSKSGGLEHLKSYENAEIEEISIHQLNPIDLWKVIASEIVSKIENEKSKVLIDLTSMRAECIHFFVAQLSDKGVRGKVSFVYCGAGAYLTGINEEDRWLTRGVKDIRSVLSYPGIMKPSRKAHLIILTGFDLDKAKELILHYEPASISLGIGLEPYAEEFLEINRTYEQQVEAFIRGLSSKSLVVSKFEFYSSDANKTKECILEEARKFSQSNITVAPMNTKVSTFGASLAASENEEIKLCYVEPLEYNRENYSKAGSVVSFVDF